MPRCEVGLYGLYTLICEEPDNGQRRHRAVHGRVLLHISIEDAEDEGATKDDHGRN